MSVVKDYVLFRKYNLQEVVKGSKGEELPAASGAGDEGSADGAEAVEEKTGSKEGSKETTRAEAQD